MLTSDLYLVTTLDDEWNSANDATSLSLREAISKAATDGSTSDNDLIKFDPALFANGPQTITLTHDQNATLCPIS